jgi:hypothetical protein
MIFTRYLRSSIGGGLMSACIFATAVYGGIHLYNDYKSPYELMKKDGQYYLMEKATEKKKIITHDFELGTLEQRLTGIFRDSKKKVVEALDKIEKR